MMYYNTTESSDGVCSYLAMLLGAHYKTNTPEVGAKAFEALRVLS